MPNYKISIIIPIYNAETFLKTTLESVINQTIGFNNIELILIDDCSTDNSKNIIKEYSDMYNNIIPIFLEKNSKTPSIPRNIAIEKATGKYLMFLDSDDEYMPDICERLYYEIIKSKSDLVTANAITKIEDREIIDINYSEPFYEITPNKDLSLFKTFRIWGTIYNKSFIKKNNIRFIIVSINEDTYFNYKCFLRANKIIYLNDYHGVIHYENYHNNHTSLTNSFNKFNVNSTIDAFIKIKDLIATENPNNDFKYDPFIKNIFVRFENEWDMSKKDKIDILERIYQYEKNSKYVIQLPIHHRIMNFFLMKKMFYLTLFLKKTYSIILNSNLFRKYIIPKKKRFPVS